jgi:hypothetical protein
VASLTPVGSSRPPRGNLARHGAAGGPSRSTASGSSSKVDHFSVRDEALLRKEIEQYVRDYVKAVSGNHLQDELRFYADRVDYLGNGPVDRRVIESSLRKYYGRWPRHTYSTPEKIEFKSMPVRGQIVLRFQTAFSLRNHGNHARGQMENEMIINAATVDPRIVSISERRVRL